MRSPRPLFVLMLLYLLVSLLILSAFLLAERRRDLKDFFDEEGPATAASAGLIFAAAAISGAMAVRRARQDPRRDLRSPRTFWALASVGFVYLAFDEMLEWHEKLDLWIHRTLGLEVTAWSDRLDDVIVGLYGIAGLTVFWIFRGELRRYRKALRYFAAGFALLALMVLLDLLTNRHDIIPALVPLGARAARTLRLGMTLGEEVMKLYAGATFLTACYSCWWTAGASRELPDPEASPAEAI